MIYDCIVIGGGPAGAALAVRLRRADLQVALLDVRPVEKNETAPRDWMTLAGTEQTDALEIPRAPWCGKPLKSACFHSRDLIKKATSSSHPTPAYRVDYTALVDRLRHEARDAGVDLRDNAEVERVDAAEMGVRVYLKGAAAKPVEGKFVVYADGATGALRREGRQASVWIAEAELDVPAKTTDDAMHWALTSAQPRIDSVMWWFEAKRVHVRLTVEDARQAAIDRLREWVARLGERKTVDCSGDLPADAVRLRPAPHPPALECESHVGKRSLVIGDAGGFVAPFSHEGMYPAVWSAMLAADVVAQACRSPHPQDALREFSTRWRTAMGGYLRPPNTDMQFLLPLVFTNQQMTDRLASAFWTGENI